MPRGEKRAAAPADLDFVGEQYRLHSAVVYRRCLALGRGDVAWAEDVMHDVFMRLLEAGDAIDKKRNVVAWLKTTTFRLCIDRLRRDGTIWARVLARLSGISASAAPPSQEVALRAKADLRRVSEIFDQLPPAERTVAFMHSVEGLKQREIAEALGFSEGYVSKLLRRATERLRAAGWEVAE
jgi:RNA polymerase sigma-70 factor, ECF subfamily